MDGSHISMMIILGAWSAAKIWAGYKSPAEREAIREHRKLLHDIKERTNQTYIRLNQYRAESGRPPYQKIDEGWWSTDPALLEHYSGLVARWRPGGDLYEERAH